MAVPVVLVIARARQRRQLRLGWRDSRKSVVVSGRADRRLLGVVIGVALTVGGCTLVRGAGGGQDRARSPAAPPGSAESTRTWYAFLWV